MGEGMEHDIFQLTLVGEPLDVFQALAQHRGSSFGVAVGGFGVKKHDDGLPNLLVDVLIGYLGKSF
jgi:hypothetical protein